MSNKFEFLHYRDTDQETEYKGKATGFYHYSVALLSCAVVFSPRSPFLAG